MYMYNYNYAYHTSQLRKIIKLVIAQNILFTMNINCTNFSQLKCINFTGLKNS